MIVTFIMANIMLISMCPLLQLSRILLEVRDSISGTSPPSRLESDTSTQHLCNNINAPRTGPSTELALELPRPDTQLALNTCSLCLWVNSLKNGILIILSYFLYS